MSCKRKIGEDLGVEKILVGVNTVAIVEDKRGPTSNAVEVTINKLASETGKMASLTTQGFGGRSEVESIDADGTGGIKEDQGVSAEGALLGGGVVDETVGVGGRVVHDKHEISDSQVALIDFDGQFGRRGVVRKGVVLCLDEVHLVAPALVGHVG